MFDVHFKLRYTRKNKQPDYNLPAWIQFVVNIDGIYSSPRSTGISVMGNKWSGVQQKIMGSSEEVQAQNRRLSSIKAGLDKLHQELCLVKDFVTPQYLVDVYVGKKEKRITVIKSFECLLEELNNPTDPTAPILKPKILGKYDKCYEYLVEFLSKEKWEAVEVVQFTHPMAEKYRRFLYSKGFGQDHVSRYVSYLKKSFALSKQVGDSDSNPILDVPCPRMRRF
ncbi:MAG: phage integrase SAM-like domain-containing protein [Runella zeae]